MEYNGQYIKRLGHFILIEEINNEEIFPQYLAMDKENGKLFLGKLIPPIYLEDNNIRINLHREINNLRKLSHNNIIYIRSTINSTSNSYIITEYCNGGTLKDFQLFYLNIKKTKFNEKFIQNAINQIVSGLEYLHKNNIVHRYIKLENIFINFNKYKNEIINGNIPPKINYSDISLDDSITFKIGNFFHSKRLTKSNSKSDFNSSIFYEPNYVSPEMVDHLLGNDNSNKNKYDDKIYDIWSLGIITYELLTGKKPFEGKNKEDIYNHIIKGTYELPAYLKASKEIITFINGILQYNPNKRFDWIQIKEHPFLKNNVENFTYIEKDIILNTKDNNLNFGEYEETSYIKLKRIDEEINELKNKIKNLQKENSEKMKDFEKELNKLKDNNIYKSTFN